ncbi:MCE family protein [Actinomadura sp. HBU206391]|uniref:MCE family protein n=1 Tax=Actinomadura sp. HBU206391 TaxID=2731692 RepID=UPI00164F746F|nr:MlaD family protein [Actinomadura sp. HBU206391]MBC6461371.1 MCE family protein [Actinomadura sp. HBU206391]
MIIKPGVKIQLLVFAVITVLGVCYTGIRYIGIGGGLLNRSYVAYVDLTDSGGIFTGAEVTYRGVPVGRVGPIELTRDGIRVKVTLQRGRHIPRDSIAVVANRSAVGEQYIDLQPRADGGPYLDTGDAYTIPRERTRLPVSTTELLGNVDRLVSSVNPRDLGVIVDELDKAFSGSAADLQAILDSSDRLLETAEKSYPATAELLDNGKVVLDTQRSQGTNIRNLARNLNDLTAQVRHDDPSLRSAIANTAPAAQQAGGLIDDLTPTLPVLLANMTTTGQVLTSRIDGLRHLLVLYPMALAGSFTVTPGDGTEHFGLVMNVDSPPPCTKGYEKTKIRYPQNTKQVPAETKVGCTLPKDSQQVVRGARNAPAPRPYPQVPPGATEGAGEPPGGAQGGAGSQASGEEPGATARQSTSDGSVQMAGYDPVTGVVYGPDGRRYEMSSAGGQQRLLGDASWKWLLLGPLAQ